MSDWLEDFWNDNLIGELTPDDCMRQAFAQGARAMFDHLMARAANNYHGNKEVQKLCEEENAIIESWAVEALESVSIEDYNAWRSIDEAYAEGLKTSKWWSCEFPPDCPKGTWSEAVVVVTDFHNIYKLSYFAEGYWQRVSTMHRDEKPLFWTKIPCVKS